MEIFTGKLTFVPKAHKAHVCERCGQTIMLGDSCFKKAPKHFGEQETFWCELCKEKNERELRH